MADPRLINQSAGEFSHAQEPATDEEPAKRKVDEDETDDEDDDELGCPGC